MVLRRLVDLRVADQEAVLGRHVGDPRGIGARRAVSGGRSSARGIAAPPRPKRSMQAKAARRRSPARRMPCAGCWRTMPGVTKVGNGNPACTHQQPPGPGVVAFAAVTSFRYSSAAPSSALASRASCCHSPRVRVAASGELTRFQNQLIPVLATLGITGALVATGAETPSPTVNQAVAAPGRPNVLVIETDDRRRRSMRVMDNVNSLIGDQGATFRRTSSTTRSAALRAPPSSPASTCTTTACSATRRRRAASTASRRCTETTTSRVWLRNAGYYTAMIGRYLNGYVTARRCRRAGRSGTRARTRRVYDYTLDENGTLVEYGQTPPTSSRTC